MGYDFLFDLAIILFTAKMLSIVARKINLPEVVGQIAAGLLIGPAVLNIVKPDDFIRNIAEIGVIMLMFEVGLETDLKKLRSTGKKATLIAMGVVVLPLIAGAVLYLLFYGGNLSDSSVLIEALFIGTIMTATSVSITVAVLKELNVLNGTIGTTITSAAIIDDVLGIVVLTFVIGMKSKGTSIALVLGKAILFFVLALVFGVLINKFFVWYDKKYEHTRRITISSLVFCLVMAFIAERFFGIADITGAYIAGVVLCNLTDSKYIERRIDISCYMIFAPVFFAGIGLKVSFQTMNLHLLAFSLAFAIVAMLGKLIGCGGIAKLTGSSMRDAAKIGFGMMARGEVALITVQKGLDAGVLTSEFLTPVIVLILISSFTTPILLKKSFTSDKEVKTA